MSASQKSDSSDLRAVQNAFQNMKVEPTKSTDEASKKSYTYNAERVLGSGSFGVVYQAVVVETGESVAIKKVFQDKRYKNRELQIMKELKHPNVVELKHAFYTSGDKPGETYLNVVMEYCSDTVYRVMKHYTKMKQPVPHIFVQIYSYQMARACAYIHAVGICHRDIKPQNLLVEGHTHALKICDFGSAKPLVKGEPNVAYICSRYYRAPELIFGATDYGFVIDIWSMACVSVLGTPTREELMAMNPNYTEFKFPQIKPHPWHKVFRARTSADAVDYISKLLVYDPKLRPTGLQCCTHALFDDLRDQNTKISSNKPLPEHLFHFSKEELALMDAELQRKLIPAWVAAKPAQ